jgi:hypothetical protein
MEAITVKRQYNLQTWTPIISECKNSGMTIKDWCNQNDIRPAKFYYWQKQIREELSSSLQLSQTNEHNLNFVEVKEKLIPPLTSKADMVLAIGGVRLEINNSASPTLLTQVLKVIAHV